MFPSKLFSIVILFTLSRQTSHSTLPFLHVLFLDGVLEFSGNSSSFSKTMGLYITHTLCTCTQCSKFEGQVLQMIFFVITLSILTVEYFNYNAAVSPYCRTLNTSASLFVEKSCAVDTTSVWNLAILAIVHLVLCQVTRHAAHA